MDTKIAIVPAAEVRVGSTVEWSAAGDDLIITATVEEFLTRNGMDAFRGITTDGIRFVSYLWEIDRVTRY